MKSLISPDWEWDFTYTYGNDGNLHEIKEIIGETGYTHVINNYDNKKSMASTNPINQFMARDYSMNNPFQGESYTPEDYPSTWMVGKKNVFYYCNLFPFSGTVKITYSR